MDAQEAFHWDNDTLEAEYHALMEEAHKHLHPEWEHGEVVVMRTARGGIYTLEIPDFQDPSIREPIENSLLRTLEQKQDTEIRTCLATINGKVPDILSWNLRSGLISLNQKNLQTLQFLWGGGETIHIKPFRALLPPQKINQK